MVAVVVCGGVSPGKDVSSAIARQGAAPEGSVINVTRPLLVALGGSGARLSAVAPDFTVGPGDVRISPELVGEYCRSVPLRRVGA